MKHIKQRKKKGFTLIEILIAISIIAIIAAIVLGSMQAYRNKGKDVKVRQTLADVQVRLENNEIAPGVVNYQTAFTQVNVQKAITSLATDLGVASAQYSYSASASDYVIVFPLTNGTYYCVDAAHNSKVVNGLPNTTGSKNCDNTVGYTGGTGGTTGGNQSPIANAGLDQTITLPANTATLSGSGTDSDGTIVSYIWTKVSGPTGGTISNASTGVTTVTSLVAGTYTYRLTVVDNGGLSASDDVVITVKAQSTTCFGSCPHTIPGTIQAEDYDNGGEGTAYHDTSSGNAGGAYRSDGVDIENTADTGGGYDIGWTANGEWLKYTVNVTTAGNYQISGRVASGAGGGYYRVLIDGQEATAIVVPNTGGWQTWQTISVDGVPLSAGTHIMQIELHIYGIYDGINLNYFSFTYQGVATAPNPSVRSLALHGQLPSAFGSAMYFYDSLPRGYYDNPSKTYPLLVFLHGGGEVPPAPPTSLLTGAGVINQINNGAQLEYTINGQTQTFVVIAPQSDWWDVWNVDRIIEYAKLNYKIDTSRIYLTGLSIGSAGTAKYFAYSPAYGDAFPRKLAAAAIFDGMTGTPPTDETNQDGSANVPLNYCYAGSASVPLWIFDASGHWPQWTDSLIATLNGCTSKVDMKVTYNNDSDSYWKGYISDHTYYNPNVYEWLLQHSRGGVAQPPANVSPTANAGTNQTITLPTSSVTLTGSGTDSDGTIASYSWGKQSGTGGTITSPSSATTTVTGLTAGTYVYRLTVTDNQGATGYSDVTITVNNAPSGGGSTPYGGTARAIPGTIQAEDFDNGGEGVAYHDADPSNQAGQYRPTEGVDIETKTGGGYDIGWTNAGEWMKYTVNIPTAKTYTLQLTTASPYGSTANVTFDVDGTTLITATMPQTTSFQDWKTFTAGTVTLPAGTHVIRIYENTTGFNIDSFSLN